MRQLHGLAEVHILQHTHNLSSKEDMNLVEVIVLCFSRREQHIVTLSDTFPNDSNVMKEYDTHRRI